MIHYPLDNIGFVQYVDHMGKDVRAVNGARVSMHKEHTEMEPGDANLLRYLSDHDHWTPYAHPQLTLRIKMPIALARQWFRSTVGFARNEMSRRYVTEEPEVFVPTEWRLRPDGNIKQGSSNKTIIGTFQERVDLHVAESVALYNQLLEYDIAPEEARFMLLQSTYTEFMETGSLYAYARIVRLRRDESAQSQIRKYADAVSSIVSELFPESWAALMEER